MLNQQIPIKQQLRTDGVLQVNSIFYTIQGEGIHAGTPAIFVRLAGCNLQCPGCDTEYTKSVEMDVDQLRKKIHLTAHPDNANYLPLVVITGGEPFRQNIQPLVERLLNLGYRVQIETNGTLFVDLGWAFIHRNFSIVCSPKTGKINGLLWPHITALKYVIRAMSVDPADGLPILALDHSAAPKVARPWDYPNFKGKVFVQPMDEQNKYLNKQNMDTAVRSCLQYGYTLCLQIHKIIGVD